MTQQRTGVTGGFHTKPSITERRKQMRFKISTTSTTASGVVPIRGATRYPDEPTIYFTREAWVKQCHLVDKCSKEVGWFALVDYNEDGNSFTITELVIPKQEVTAAETDIGKENLADAAMELIEQGKDTSKMFAWFHSHVNMGVSPSVQDEFQVEDFLEDLADQPEVPAFIRGIQNKKGELKLDVYYIQHGVAYQNVNFYVIHDDDPQWRVDIEAEIAAKVTERTCYNDYYSFGYGGQGGGRQNVGKSEVKNANGNERKELGNNWDFDSGFRRSYDYWDQYDTYNQHNKVKDPKTRVLGAVEVTQEEYFDMTIVYQGTDNIDVLSSDDGQLWVCDGSGDFYYYDDYIETFGDIGGGIGAGKQIVVK